MVTWLLIFSFFCLGLLLVAHTMIAGKNDFRRLLQKTPHPSSSDDRHGHDRWSHSFLFFSLTGTVSGHQQVPFTELILVMVIGFTLLPLPVSMDIRGWQEMHPLNGPSWSLFFEYLANIIYALILVKLPNKVLIILTLLAALALVHFAVTSPNGDIIGGWSLDAVQLRIGITRLSYPFLAGLLLSRVFRGRSIRSTFLLCSLLLIAVLACPRIGGQNELWMNGLYDSFCIIIVFPMIVYLGAGGNIRSSSSLALCRFLGELSYPLYMVHYPFIYIFSAYVVNNHLKLINAWLPGAFVFIGVIVLAYAALKLYDLPVRNWLTKKYIRAKR